MDAVSFTENEEERSNSVSSHEDFAETYLFLEKLGPYMNLPPISLSDLENFFKKDYFPENDQVVYIQWRLLRYTGRHGGIEDWQRMAVKFARKVGLLTEAIPYSDSSLRVRMKIFRLSCEEQFDCNVNLRNNMKRDAPGMLTKPVGVDREGVRYWFLEDSTFNIRLYGEGSYNEVPPISATWILLARSLDGLANHLSLLESRNSTAGQGIPISSSSEEKREISPPPSSSSHLHLIKSDSHSEVTSSNGELSFHQIRYKKCSKEVAILKKGTNRKKPSPSPDSDGGCLKCLKDIDHDKMLLCDACDRECHTYCQYPVLWSVPKGKWLCSICKEEALVKELKELYLRLSKAKSHHDQRMERKQRSVARLQKSGLLLQNILEGNDPGSKRSRRSRKQINYAELNDIVLPPLGPRDIVGSEEKPPSTRSKRNTDFYVHEDYLKPRVRTSSRRFRGQSPSKCLTLETVEEKDEEIKPPNDNQKPLSDDSSPILSRTNSPTDVSDKDELSCTEEIDVGEEDLCSKGTMAEDIIVNNDEDGSLRVDDSPTSSPSERGLDSRKKESIMLPQLSSGCSLNDYLPTKTSAVSSSQEVMNCRAPLSYTPPNVGILQSQMYAGMVPRPQGIMSYVSTDFQPLGATSYTPTYPGISQLQGTMNFTPNYPGISQLQGALNPRISLSQDVMNYMPRYTGEIPFQGGRTYPPSHAGIFQSERSMNTRIPLSGGNYPSTSTMVQDIAECSHQHYNIAGRPSEHSYNQHYSVSRYQSLTPPNRELEHISVTKPPNSGI